MILTIRGSQGVTTAMKVCPQTTNAYFSLAACGGGEKGRTPESAVGLAEVKMRTPGSCIPEDAASPEKARK